MRTRSTRLRTLAAVATAVVALTGCGGGEEEPSVSFEQLEDGAAVRSPVAVEMAAQGVTVEPAANGVNEGSGHFDLAIDADCVRPGDTIPDDDAHQHFSDGATTAELDLSPGQHTLCLQFATGDHVATALTDEISITVLE
jgi:hypothetical protein